MVRRGRGQIHLSVAIAYRAIQHGFDALFTTATQLSEDLGNASRTGRLHEALDRYTHPHVLVIEVGYLSYGPEAANVLYRVVNDRHLRKRPMVFTTNKPMHDWGCSTIPILPTRFSTGSSNAADGSPLTDRQGERNT